MQSYTRNQSSDPLTKGATRRTASRSSSFRLGKKGTAGNPAPSWVPNIRREGTYDSRPSKSIRQQKPETYRVLEPEQGSRIFISGLPKDITNQDLEDLMTSMIGPTREVYIIYQYAGPPLYKSSSVTSSGLERDPKAEYAENIRTLSSTGCGMVHFQREKDALEAWEQYNGKLLDGTKILRVQVVVDADESWLVPQESNVGHPDILEGDQLMETESPSRPLTPHNTKDSRGSPPSMPISRANSSQAEPPVPKGRRAPSVITPAHKTIVRPTHPSARPLSNHLSNLPLVDRVGSISSTSPDVKTGGSVALGGHSIALNGYMNNLASGPFPRVRVKKGPRRLAKLEARQRHNLALPPAPLFHGSSTLPINAPNGLTRHQQARPTFIDLDAEMDEYRRRGLMGLSSPDK